MWNEEISTNQFSIEYSILASNELYIAVCQSYNNTGYNIEYPVLARNELFLTVLKFTVVQVLTIQYTVYFGKIPPFQNISMNGYFH